MFHERDALALDGAGENERRSSVTLLVMLSRALVGARDLREIMSVDLDDVPAERFPFVDDRLDRHDVLHRPVDLAFVGVENNHEVRELELRSRHRGFPDLAFLRLAV